MRRVGRCILLSTAMAVLLQMSMGPTLQCTRVATVILPGKSKIAVHKTMNEESLLYTAVPAPDNLEKGCIFCYIHQSQNSCLIGGNTTVYTLGSPYFYLSMIIMLQCKMLI